MDLEQIIQLTFLEGKNIIHSFLRLRELFDWWSNNKIFQINQSSSLIMNTKCLIMIRHYVRFFLIKIFYFLFLYVYDMLYHTQYNISMYCRFGLNRMELNWIELIWNVKHVATFFNIIILLHVADDRWSYLHIRLPDLLKRASHRGVSVLLFISYDNYPSLDCWAIWIVVFFHEYLF